MVQTTKSALFVAVVGVLVAVVTLAPLQLQQHHQHHRRNNYHHQFDLVLPVDQGAAFKFAEAEDGTARNERSTNLSHITGTANKIELIMNHNYLHIMSDGTVNGSDVQSDYTILQRKTVNNGQIWIQGLATCLFLCMDSCGLLYGSREFTEDCVFNEMFAPNNYNLYTSNRYSNKKRTLYLALNKRGQPRKLQIRGAKWMSRLNTYAQALINRVTDERVTELTSRILRAEDLKAGRVAPANPIRHHGFSHVCPLVLGHELAEDADGGRDKFRCRTRRKRKKKKRRCEEGDEEGDCEVDTDDEGVDRNECEDGDEECSHKRVVTTQRVRTNKNNRCEEGAVGCKKKERGDQKKNNRNHKKCENGEVGCRRKEEEREHRNDHRTDVQPLNRRRCQIEEDNDQCKKRLQESRRRRRARIREKTLVSGQDENVTTRKKLTSGKNKKKFVGDGEISKDLDSGRRLAEQLEIATNLNTPADAITEASAKRAREFNKQESRNLSNTPIRAEDSVTNAEDIPSVNQRGNRDEAHEDSGETVDVEPASTPYSSAATPAPSAHFTKADDGVTSADNPHTDVTAAEATVMDYFYDDAVDK